MAAILNGVDPKVELVVDDDFLRFIQIHAVGP